MSEQPRHTGAVIGLGWMGMLYDLAQRITEVTQEMIDRGDFRQEELGRRFEMDDATRPTPTLLVHRRFQHHEHPGDSGIPSTYSEALHNRAEIDLVAAADRDTNRLAAFAERYGPAGYGGAAPRVYTDAADMLAAERPEVVAIATNTKGRAELTALAVKHGAKMILTDKPMAFSLEEADLMVRCCADAGVPLCAGSISTTHPSFERAKTLLQEGAIGELLSIEAPSPGAQHQDWSYFLDSPVSWVVGHGDLPRAESGAHAMRSKHQNRLRYTRPAKKSSWIYPDKLQEIQVIKIELSILYAGSSEFQGYDTISTLSHASLHRNGDFTQTGLGQRAENVALTQTGLGQATQNGQSSLNVQVRLPCRRGRHHSALSQRVRTYTKRDETLPGARQWKCKKIVLIYQDIFQTAVERARSLSNLMSIDSDQNYGGGRAPQVRITGSQGEMVFDTQSQHPGWRLFQQVESFGSRSDYLTAREAAVGGSYDT